MAKLTRLWRAVGAGWKAFRYGFFFVTYRLSVLAALAVASYFTFKMFIDYKTDTTAISNGAFVIVASLAALTFSWARVLGTEKDIQDRLTFAGERLFHAAVMLLVASVPKYGVLSLMQNSWISDHLELEIMLTSVSGLTAGSLFLAAVMSAHTGVRIINDSLLQRLRRYSDSDDII